MIANELGLEFTTTSADAVAALDATVQAYAGFRRDIGQHLKSTLAADPGMPMAHVLKGVFFQFMAIPELLPRAAGALATARGAGSTRGANRRERLHMDGLDAWIRGDLDAAVRAYEAVLTDHPRDLLALKLANFFHFYVGDSRSIRDGVARVLPSWHPHDHGYGFVLGLYAFGLEENGQYGEAEDQALRAVELNPADAWAVHTLAHVDEMQDRHREGIERLAASEPHWGGLNNFRYHLWWHRALLHLNRGEAVEVLRLYDERLWDATSDDYLDLVNDISLLQRLEMAGADVGERWQPLADKVEKLRSARYFAFIDVHYLLALAAAGRDVQARDMLAAMRQHAADSDTTIARVTASVAGALCDGLLAYRCGDAARAAELMAPLRGQWQLLGGSHAQRELLDEILIDASLAAGRYDYARGILSERSARRPGNRWNGPRLAAALVGMRQQDVAAARPEDPS